MVIKSISSPEISEKVSITAKFQKTEFYKYATSRVSPVSITYVLI